RTPHYPLADFAVDLGATLPRHRQLYGVLRAAILEGRLARGTRLPSSRLLAAELGCARGTVILAFDQLHAEGYLRSAGGSGPFVAEEVPEELLSVRRRAARRGERAGKAPPRLSRHAAALLGGAARPASERPFASGRPALDAFP